MAKVKVRVIMPHVLAGAGGPAYAEGEVELEEDVAKVAEELGGVEIIGKKRGRPKKTTAVASPKKPTTPAPKASAGLRKTDVPGAG